MTYIERDASGAIIRSYANPQEDVQTEEVADDDAELALFLNPPVVRVVDMAQARLALLAMGLLDDVEQALELLPEEQKRAAKIEWEFRQTVRSDNALVIALTDMLGLDLDQLFDIAEGIQ